MLLMEIEEETTTDKLEADIVKMVDYNDNFILPWKTSATRMIDGKQAIANERSIGVVMWVHIQAD